MKPDKVLCSRFLFAFFGLDLGLDRAQNTIGVYSGLRNQPILQGHGPFRFINYGFDMLVLILMSWPSALAHNNNNNNNLLLIQRKYLYEYIQMRLTSYIKIILK